MALVMYVDKGTNIDKAIKRFSKIIFKEGIINDYKRKIFFEKPSKLKRREKNKNILRIAKELREKSQNI